MQDEQQLRKFSYQTKKNSDLKPPHLIRIDLHAHTTRSPDGGMSPARFVEEMRAAGVQRAAVTDHGVIRGALEAQALDPELIIVGEEIRCDCGTELIGLFLSEKIPEGLPLNEVASCIRQQGGVVYAPHPFAYARQGRLRATRALEVADVVEVFNGRAFLPGWNRAAENAAAAAGLPGFASSDAHFAREVGRAYTEMPAFTGAESFRSAVHTARPVGLFRGSPIDHFASTALWAGELLGVRRLARGARKQHKRANGDGEGSARGERRSSGGFP